MKDAQRELGNSLSSLTFSLGDSIRGLQGLGIGGELESITSLGTEFRVLGDGLLLLLLLFCSCGIFWKWGKEGELGTSPPLGD